MNEYKLLKTLVNAAAKKDFVLYEKLVTENAHILDGFIQDDWQEIFCDGPREEIEWWINYPHRKLSIRSVAD
jgi:hypothetical protein